MAEIVGFPEAFAAAVAEVAPVLDERQWRRLLGAEAREQSGVVGSSWVAGAVGVSADTVGQGRGELEAGVVAPDGRVRA